MLWKQYVIEMYVDTPTFNAMFQHNTAAYGNES